MLQPVLVRPVAGGTYELVAGERRWRAAPAAGLEQIPAIVQQRDDAQTLEAALIENMAREDLNPVEEARAVAALVEELGLTREEVGRRVGRSRVAVSNLLRLLDLPDDVLALLESGALTEGHGRALLLAEDHGDRRRLARDAAEQGWSVRVTEARAREATHARAALRDEGPRRAASRPGRGRAGDRRGARRGARAPRSRSGRGAPATRSRWPSRRPTRRSRWPAACGSAPSPEAPPATLSRARMIRRKGD